jgi:hypothetical protein
VIKFTSACPWSAFSPGTPASSTTKTGCHDIAEILLKVALKHQKSNHINIIFYRFYYWLCVFGIYDCDSVFYDFSIGFWNCSKSVVCYVFHLIDNNKTSWEIPKE